jgi:hypothetical protein
MEGLSPIVGNPKKLRSKMSNGSKLLPLTDGRSAMEGSLFVFSRAHNQFPRVEVALTCHTD